MAKKKAAEGLGVVETLRQALRASGRSLTRIAAESGVDQPRISRFLRGERDIGAQSFEKLCKVMRLKLVREEEE
jgi:transcriptional regulator with XRE-family HTH domain